MAGIGSHPYLIHYVLADGPNAGECRPAAVVREWTDESQPYYNLLVFADGPNDGVGDDPVLWKTSVYRGPDGQGHTWHTHGECAVTTAARAEAAAATPTPPEAAPPLTPSADSAPSGGSADDEGDEPMPEEVPHVLTTGIGRLTVPDVALDPTAPQSGSAPSDSSGDSAAAASPSPSPDAPPADSVGSVPPMTASFGDPSRIGSGSFGGSLGVTPMPRIVPDDSTPEGGDGQ